MQITRKQVALIHLLVVGPLLAYVGHQGAETKPILFKILLALGVIVALYHGKNLYEMSKKQNA